MDGGGIFDSSVEAWFCACNSKLVTVCLLALLRVRTPFDAPVAVAAFPEFPLVDPDDAVGIPVVCLLLAVIECRKTKSVHIYPNSIKDIHYLSKLSKGNQHSYLEQNGDRK
jgi:hypothetical protein